MIKRGFEAWSEDWASALVVDPSLRLFALVDPAQDKRVLSLIVDDGLPNECLFGYEVDSPIALATPRLVLIQDPTNSRLVAWLSRVSVEKPVASLIASVNDLELLTAHLRHCIDVELQGLDSMFLALWDPAILGTLVGQTDDLTLHVAGPVLTLPQAENLLSALSHWWYCDRQGFLHDALSKSPRNGRPYALPAKLVLDQEQVDALVEASVPDHLMQHIFQNQPELAERVDAKDRYQFVRQQLQRARDHGLTGTGDWVNYICIALAYGAKFDQKPELTEILAKVKVGELTFDAALDQFPESDLEAGAESPVLL